MCVPLFRNSFEKTLTWWISRKLPGCWMMLTGKCIMIRRHSKKQTRKVLSKLRSKTSKIRSWMKPTSVNPPQLILNLFHLGSRNSPWRNLVKKLIRTSKLISITLLLLMLVKIELSALIARSWHLNSSLKKVELHRARLNRYQTMKVPKNPAWVLTAQALTCRSVGTIMLVVHARDNQNGQLL